MSSPDSRGELLGTFADLSLPPGFDSGDDILTRFYIPVLQRAVRYDRSVGYFRSSALSVAARGMARFLRHCTSMRLLVGADLTEVDVDALQGKVAIPEDLAARLASQLVTTNDVDRQRLGVLGWMVKQGLLQVKVAVPRDPISGRLLPRADAGDGYFHEKIGVLWDAGNVGIAFQGSINESLTAWTKNFESFSVFRSDDGTAAHFDLWAAKFDERWKDEVPSIKVFDLPAAVEQHLISISTPDDALPLRDPAEPAQRADRGTVAKYLAVASRLWSSAGLAEATCAVAPFPHQRKVAERLAGLYPRPWLVADEVGLGKTISAGLALRRLLLSGQVKRALILAPANVARQWQDEMFEKFGLWVPRYDQGRIWGAHPSEVTEVPSGSNPYDTHHVLLVSSHLARLPKHRAMILASRHHDLLVVDEAHHARRSGSDLDRYQPSHLLRLLDEVREHDHATALWLMTATPMQVDPIELVDLLSHLGFSGPLAEMPNLMAFYAELAKKDDAKTNWKLLHRGVESLHHIPGTEAEATLLDRIERKLNILSRERIERFGTPGTDPSQLVSLLSPAEKRELREWIRQRSPVGLFMTRHTRATLKRLRDDGLLTEPLADRDVQAKTINFSPYEQALYDDLTALLDRLNAAHGTKKGAGFVLTVYRRRLTSSWAAIRNTITNRLAKEESLIEDALFEDEFDSLEDDTDGRVDDRKALPLTDADLDDLRGYLNRLDQISLSEDAKYRRLTTDIDSARAEGRAVIVFTQFTDTLAYLRDALQSVYGQVLATYTGSGGAVWQAGHWHGIAKKDLVDRVRARKVDIILATDAASEGLNLQALNTVINFDLPWNPMRVEQRIGRIDRLGQQAPTVIIRNYVIPGTVEESVYSALADRIDLFSGIVGNLQPILGATERAFERVFRAPASERERVKKEEIAALLAKADELQTSGLLSDSDEDPWPDPSYPPSPVTLASLRDACIEDLDISPSNSDRAASFEPGEVSRDPQKWRALATYGHPQLDADIAALAAVATIDPAVVIHDAVVSAVVRADQTPPLPVLTLAGLDDLGTPVAVGEAEDEATRLTSSERLIRLGHLDDSRRLSRQDDNRRTSQEVGRLIRRAVVAESILRRRSGTGLSDPFFVWKDLSAESPWSHAVKFCGRVGVRAEDLMLTTVPHDDGRPENFLRSDLRDSGAELVELIKAWLARQKP